jgi:hypothetical protein
MKRLFLILAAFLLVTRLGGAHMLTLTDGRILQVSNLVFEAGSATFCLGTETQTLQADHIRDISFSAQAQNASALSTATVDLLPYLKEGQAIFKRFPDSASISVLDHGEYLYQADGTSVTRNRQILLVTKEEARGIADVGLSFDPNREKVRILHARCLSPDGRLHSVTPENIKITKAGSGGVFFNNYQQVSFTIPQVNVGGLVDYAYEIEEFNPFDKHLFQGYFTFQGTQPIVTSTLKVVLATSTPLNFLPVNCTTPAGTPLIEHIGSTTAYTWTFSQMSPIIGEPQMPAFRDVVPGVAFCLQKDWNYLFEKLRPMFAKRFQLTDLVKQKVDELLIGATTIEDKIDRLYRFCQKEIRYVSIKGNLASNQVGHPAEETLHNKYGDCTDKGMLLATMLKHIGIEAYPVGILTNSMGTALRSLPIFDSNHCITEIHHEGKRFYLDSTATDYRFPYFRGDDHDTIAENPVLGTHTWVPLPPPEDNAMRVRRDIRLSPDGTTKIEVAGTVNGPTEAGFRASTRNMKPEEYIKSVRASVAGLTSDYTLELATHSNPLDFSGPFTYSSGYTLNRFAPRSGTYMVFDIPQFRMSFPEISLASRTFDIVYSTTSLREDSITIHLPPGFSVKYLPESLTIKTPHVSFVCTYTAASDTVRIERAFAIHQRRVPLAQYESHREALEKIARFTEERLFLAETTSTGGNTP